MKPPSPIGSSSVAFDLFWAGRGAGATGGGDTVAEAVPLLDTARAFWLSEEAKASSNIFTIPGEILPGLLPQVLKPAFMQL